MVLFPMELYIILLKMELVQLEEAARAQEPQPMAMVVLGWQQISAAAPVSHIIPEVTWKF